MSLRDDDDENEVISERIVAWTASSSFLTVKYIDAFIKPHSMDPNTLTLKAFNLPICEIRMEIKKGPSPLPKSSKRLNIAKACPRDRGNVTFVIVVLIIGPVGPVKNPIEIAARATLQ